MDEKKYSQTVEELEKKANAALKNTIELKRDMEKKRKVDLNRQFSLINLPSMGRYYPNKNKFFLIRYLTAVEEHVLCDSMLMESGIGIKLVLENIIIDDNIDVNKLVLNDFQAILIFLRSTSYGDLVNFLIKCPSCGREEEHSRKLSELNFKEVAYEKEDERSYVLEIPELNLFLEISPLTLEKEVGKQEFEGKSDFFFFKNEDGVETKIRKERTLSFAHYIDSVNGITDREKIKEIVRKIPKKYFDKITSLIKDNEDGIDENLNFECSFCGHKFQQKILIGYDFLSLPPSYKESIYEEVFLITYYGKGITRADAIAMPVVERKWHIQRIKKEIDAQNEAEKRAMQNAKSSKGKF